MALCCACNEGDWVQESLTAKTKEAVPGPDCASCHAYPLRDTNHVYHLFKTGGTIVNNRPITCLNCHDLSIASHVKPFPDSVFRDPFDREFHGLDFPEDTELRTFPLVRVDTLYRRRPVPAPERAGSPSEIQEWMTSLAHLNGVVDVVFDSASSDTARFHGAKAAFNPTQETCSAVACHPTHGVYRFADPAKGLSELHGDSLGEFP